ncbi:hypothetical protein DSM110093_02922 [Sulfitobacter sp. DSM 110093]|nr:hypothetical protein DSM110093_02922 [Sulfitobacter sp. DSM 110093]
MTHFGELNNVNGLPAGVQHLEQNECFTLDDFEWALFMFPFATYRRAVARFGAQSSDAIRVVRRRGGAA